MFIGLIIDHLNNIVNNPDRFVSWSTQIGPQFDTPFEYPVFSIDPLIRTTFSKLKFIRFF